MEFFTVTGMIAFILGIWIYPQGVKDAEPIEFLDVFTVLTWSVCLGWLVLLYHLFEYYAFGIVIKRLPQRYIHNNEIWYEKHE